MGKVFRAGMGALSRGMRPKAPDVGAGSGKLGGGLINTSPGGQIPTPMPTPKRPKVGSPGSVGPRVRGVKRTNTSYVAKATSVGKLNVTRTGLHPGYMAPKTKEGMGTEYNRTGKAVKSVSKGKKVK